jgi:hypothetical protein
MPKLSIMIELTDMIQNIAKIFEYEHFYLVASLLFLFIVSDPRSFYEMWKLYNALENHEALPERLRDFPVHSTSIEVYVVSQEKVNKFVLQACKGEICSLTLSEHDINNLYLRGESVDKYKINYSSDPFFVIFKYVNELYYFQITNDGILERRVNYISLAGVNGIRTETRETRFINDTDSTMLCHNLIDQQGKKMDRDSDWTEENFFPIRPNNSLLYALLTNDFKCLSYDENESQRNFVASIIKKITCLKIRDGCLVIEISQPTDHSD